MEFNYTVPAVQPLDLYAGANFTYSDLSWGEKRWVDWYSYMANPTIATGVMSFMLHELVYFGRCVPWIIIDAVPYFRRWKLQPGKIPTAAEQWECTKHLLLSHFTVTLPQIWLFHPVCEYFGMRTYQVPFPEWKTTCWQLMWFFVMEDAWHYFAHQALHYGPLYRHIHKIHHKYSAPFGLAAEYAHPLEMIILGVGTVGSPILYTMVTHNFHIVTMYIWICLRLFQAIDAHSGYDFPWSLHNIFPLWSGAEHHDYHHMAFTNNFSTSFRYLDYIFGTDDKYRAYKARLSAVKATDRASVEKQLLEQAEKDGIEAERIAENKKFGSRKSD